MTQVVTLHLPVGVEFALGLKGERRIHSKISQNPRAMNQRLFPMQLKETFPTIGISTGHHGLTHFSTRVFSENEHLYAVVRRMQSSVVISKNQMFGGSVLHKKLPQEWRGTGENSL